MFYWTILLIVAFSLTSEVPLRHEYCAKGKLERDSKGSHFCSITSQPTYKCPKDSFLQFFECIFKTEPKNGKCATGYELIRIQLLGKTQFYCRKKVKPEMTCPESSSLVSGECVSKDYDAFKVEWRCSDENMRVVTVNYRRRCEEKPKRRTLDYEDEMLEQSCHCPARKGKKRCFCY